MSKHGKRPCGCHVSMIGHMPMSITYCAVHEAAPLLLAAGKRALAEYDERTWTDPASETGPAHDLRVAVNQAEAK